MGVLAGKDYGFRRKLHRNTAVYIQFDNMRQNFPGQMCKNSLSQHDTRLSRWSAILF